MGLRSCLAVTQLESNLTLSGTGEITQHFLRALLFDPSRGWEKQQLDLNYPMSSVRADTGQFVVSAMGDLDGDGQAGLVYAVSLEPSNCYIFAYRYDRGTWRSQPILSALPSVELVRCIALGDVDNDGADEIVLGTRPDGAVLILKGESTEYVATTIDRHQFGAGTTNTREVVVADIDSDGSLEIIVATARAEPKNKWQATPGSIFLYKRWAHGWNRVLIDDHDGRTHTRMVAVADVRGDGISRIISSAVGVFQPEADCINPQPELRMYTLTGTSIAKERIGTLENMIKSRSFAVGDVDGDGRTALVVGTRALGIAGLKTTFLFIYRYDQNTHAWERETLDTSGPFGFHCVTIADIDGDGRSEIIASDDGRGLIKLFKKKGRGWQHDIIYAAKGAIFCSAIHAVKIRSS
jgi:FG-GAP-like repeat